MACPDISQDEITMLKTARERLGYGYDGTFSVTGPIYMSDLQRISGGNSSGSGNSYLAVNTLNPIENRPDGSNPLEFEEFSKYNRYADPYSTFLSEVFVASNTKNESYITLYQM